MTTLTMKDQVAALLMRGWTSPLEALNVAGCLSLSQRVGELIQEGHHVEKSWLDLPNGKRVRIYRIKSPQQVLAEIAQQAEEAEFPF